jgi:GTP-binding protein
MVPSDSNDIKKEYNILVNELKQYNPELLHKVRILAVSKSDLLDDELKKEIKKTLPKIPHIFISSHTGDGLIKLKDLIWKKLNEEVVSE